MDYCKVFRTCFECSRLSCTFSWIDSKNHQHLGLCVTSFGRILWKILEMRRIHQSILLITLFVGAHISIGKEFHSLNMILSILLLSLGGGGSWG